MGLILFIIIEDAHQLIEHCNIPLGPSEQCNIILISYKSKMEVKAVKVSYLDKNPQNAFSMGLTFHNSGLLSQG